MMAPLTILSWNVRRLNSKIKRPLVFTYVKKYSPQICILQETHLIGSRTLALRKPWVGFYSMHSAFSRGVGVQVHKSLQFVVLDLHLDPEGSYVVLHATCDRLEILIVDLYVPPRLPWHYCTNYPRYWHSTWVLRSCWQGTST